MHHLRGNAIQTGLFAQKGYTPLSDFYKIWFVGGSPTSATPHRHAKFHRCGLKIWVYSPENCQNWYFLYTFAQNGYTPLSDVHKIWLGGASPR